MLNTCWLPDWLYKLWPWLCLAIADGYILAGYSSPGIALSVYAFAVFYKRIV
jgi:hypothetical protein